MKKKVLHLIGSNCVGGPEKQILHHAVDLQGSSYNVEVGSFEDGPQPPEILEEARRRALGTVCFHGQAHPRLINELVAVLASRGIDLLCTHGFKANVIGYLASRRTQTPHVAFLRGWTAETPQVRFYEVLERRALARAQTVVCVSRIQAAQVARLRGARSMPMVIENAMLPPFHRSGLTAAPSRSALGIAKDAFVFGSVGRLSAEKGHRFLVEAFARLHKGRSGMQVELSDRSPVHRPMHLIFVGDGREQAGLERQAEQLGIRNQVHFAGFQGNCAEWMALMDCMVQPSLTEGTPNSVLEALCVGLPVIATAVGGVPDLIVDRLNGLLVPSADSDAIKNAMSTLLADPSLHARLATAASKTSDTYSTVRQREHFLRLYEKILGPVEDAGSPGTRTLVSNSSVPEA